MPLVRAGMGQRGEHALRGLHVPHDLWREAGLDYWGGQWCRPCFDALLAEVRASAAADAA